MTARVVALVSGSVQGVGYRWFVRGLATDAGLAGSATNLADGRVEVVLEGPEDDVAAVLAALDGPGAPGAVTGVSSRREPEQGLRDSPRRDEDDTSPTRWGGVPGVDLRA